MAEYIEREAIMHKFADFVERSNNSDFVSPPTWNQAVQIVEDFHAADVQPVVRCIKCKYYKGLACCKLIGDCGGTNWFCGWGEPKKEET